MTGFDEDNDATEVIAMASVGFLCDTDVKSVVQRGVDNIQDEAVWR